MAKRQSERRPPLADFHLWHEVAQTVSPLRPSRRRQLKSIAESGPLPAPSGTNKPVMVRPMPAYRSDGRPGRPPGHGIEPGLLRRVQRGTLDIDGTIDLHGMRQSEAHAALSRFLHARVARGDRTVLVITGKGLRKTGRDAAVIVETGVLRTMLPIWLSEPALAPLVAGWDVAAQAHGGEGAYYVRLRRGPLHR